MSTLIAAVGAAVVLALGLAACSSGDDASSEPADADVAITGTAGLLFEPDTFSVPAEPTTVALTCETGPAHDLVVEVDGDVQEVVACAGGETATGELDIPAGEYDFWCTIPGHREAGMEGTVTVG